ncbi:MAG TPA: GNAT family N-acetyltransferase [Pirellulaceae bacterium]|nr:GNAT family N-acetyltransferase [Pirellulaceae bacterium]
MGSANTAIRQVNGTRLSTHDAMLTIRSYKSDDAAELLGLFRSTVREINSVDYDPVQIGAWASEEIDIQEWHIRFAGRFAYVALLDGRIVGFADMTTDGYLDRLFVSAQHQRQGVAKTLLAKLKSDASRSGIAEISTEASITAKPFFEASGFAILRKQTVVCRGVKFTNYRMVLTMMEIE